ncbi:MAG: hypothetical protein H8E66_04685 [Planctomycetes bacterium]|nr:hypothetical protein [Planctomycetota bacterium]
MRNSQNPTSDDVEHLLLNARLRDELEPYLDESIHLLDVRRMPTQAENEFLASMLAWERAPALPISQWFQPEMQLAHPDTLDDMTLQGVLQETIQQLYDQRVVLDFTDHLTDRQLYCVIYRDILPSHEKKIDLPKNFLHWHCLDDSDDVEAWLRFYATEAERQVWQEETELPLPPSEPAPYPRKMPRRPQS